MTSALTAGAQEALVSITPGGELTASTATSGAWVIENNSAGGQSIEAVIIDLSTSLVPDLVFDPTGTAGDAVGKALTPDSGAIDTGFVAPANSSVDPFSQPRNGIDGEDGYFVVTLEFTDFDPGETFSFSVDVDPTSIKDLAGVGDSRLVSGLELTGATVRVRFSDLSDFTGEAFREPATDGGSTATLDGNGLIATTISVPGVTLAPTNLSPDHAAAVVPAGATAQTIRVSGPAGANVRLLQVEGALRVTFGNELDRFEANEALAISEYSAVIEGNGSVEIPVNLTRTDAIDGGFNHFAAVIEENGVTGPNSNFVILELDSGVPNAPPLAKDEKIALGLGETLVIDVLANVSDADGTIDVSTLTIVDTPTAGTLTPGLLGAFSYTHDGVAEVVDQFTFTVADNDGATSNLATVELNVRDLVDLPADVDGDGTDNASDDDDDNDGLLDTEDPFALDADNGTTGDLPLSLPLNGSAPGTGLFGLGFTGLMSNGVIGGDPGSDYQDLYDTDRVLIDNDPDAPGGYTHLNTDAGDAFRDNNTQSHAFQVGLNVDTLSDAFVVHGRLLAPFFDDVTPVEFQSAGIFIGTGDQDNYYKLVLDGTANAAEVLLETDGVTPGGTNYGPPLLSSDAVDLFVLIDPATLTAQAQLALDGAPLENLGSPVTLPATWLDETDNFGLAMGLIQTSSGAGAVFDVNYDLLEAYFLAVDDDLAGVENRVSQPLDVLANDHPDPTLTIIAIGTPNAGGAAVLNDNGTPLDPSDDRIDYTPRPRFAGTETFTYTVRESNGAESTAVVTVTLAPAAVFSDDFESGGGG